MWFGLFLAFVAVPLLELALLIKLGQWIGFWPTLGIVVATAVLGTSILHRQGFAAFRRGMENLAAGTAPVEPVLDGALLMVAGALLLTPGLITDCAGLLLLIPPLRRAIGSWGLKRLLAAGTIHVATNQHGGRASMGDGPKPGRGQPGWRAATEDGPVIDGEFERLDEKTLDPKRGTPPKPDQRLNGRAREP